MSGTKLCTEDNLLQYFAGKSKSYVDAFATGTRSVEGPEVYVPVACCTIQHCMLSNFGWLGGADISFKACGDSGLDCKSLYVLLTTFPVVPYLCFQGDCLLFKGTVL